MYKFWLFTIGLCFTIGCSSDDISLDTNTQTEDTTTNPDDENSNPQDASHPNILFIITDDMGIDITPGYTQAGTKKAVMPTLDSLRVAGLTYDNFWAYSQCSPTRASVLTGKHAQQTGVITPTKQISTTETSLQKYINANSGADYASIIIGKWHLSKNASAPQTMGIGDFYGFMNSTSDYYDWTLYDNNFQQPNQATYTTTAFTNKAINWIDAQTKPWFCWLAYNAPHAPYTTPRDSNLFTQKNTNTNIGKFTASVEAVDAELKRLFNSMTEAEKNNTLVIFMGDNGTPGNVAQSPYVQGTTKGFMYNGGIHVPFIVSGAGVTRQNQRETALAQSTDLFATIAEATGVSNPNTTESISLLKQFAKANEATRSLNIVQGEAANGDYSFTCRDNTYKLIQHYNSADQVTLEELYKLDTDYAESDNLLDRTLSTEISAIKNKLEQEILRVKKL